MFGDFVPQALFFCLPHIAVPSVTAFQPHFQPLPVRRFLSRSPLFLHFPVSLYLNDRQCTTSNSTMFLYACLYAYTRARRPAFVSRSSREACAMLCAVHSVRNNSAFPITAHDHKFCTRNTFHPNSYMFHGSLSALIRKIQRMKWFPRLCTPANARTRPNSGFSHGERRTLARVAAHTGRERHH